MSKSSAEKECQDQQPYFSFVKSGAPTRYGQVELFLIFPKFYNSEQATLKNFSFKVDGYAIVTDAGYMLFERVSTETYKFIGFTTVVPKKTR